MNNQIMRRERLGRVTDDDFAPHEEMNDVVSDTTEENEQPNNEEGKVETGHG